LADFVEKVCGCDAEISVIQSVKLAGLKVMSVELLRGQSDIR
jgi:hypothetical protein